MPVKILVKTKNANNFWFYMYYRVSLSKHAYCSHTADAETSVVFNIAAMFYSDTKMIEAPISGS